MNNKVVQGWQMVPDVDALAQSIIERLELRHIELHYVEVLDKLGNSRCVDAEEYLVVALKEALAAAPQPPVQQCEAPSCGCADAYCKAWDEALQPSDDAKDAARYRWLLEQSGFGIRRNGVTELTVAFYEVQPDNIGQLSFAIDAAMGQGGSDE